MQAELTTGLLAAQCCSTLQEGVAVAASVRRRTRAARWRRPRLSWVLLAPALLLAGPTASRAASFTPLGDLPGGDFNSAAYGVSADGSVAVGSSHAYTAAASWPEAFRWDATNGMMGLGALPSGSGQSFGRGASADGSVVVGQSSIASGSFEAFRWDATNGLVGLGYLPGGISLSAANGVSADGSVVVGSDDISASTAEAFRWDATNGMVGLGILPGGSGSNADAVSADGSVVVGVDYSSSGMEAFRWEPRTAWWASAPSPAEAMEARRTGSPETAPSWSATAPPPREMRPSSGMPRTACSPSNTCSTGKAST